MIRKKREKKLTHVMMMMIGMTMKMMGNEILLFIVLLV